jgi:hypothetical protein
MPHERIVFLLTPKSPEDVAHVPGVDFGPRMTITNETLVGADVRIYERTTGTETTTDMLVPGSIVVADDVVSFQVRGGLDRTDYLARIFGSTNQQRLEQAVVLIPVRARVRPTS